MSNSPVAATVSLKYAKSGRSTCKGCSEAIASGALRLGTTAHDPRGFDNTKWYHVACFPAASHPLGPVENINGFDAIKDEDREELRELEKNHKTNQTIVDPLKESSPKKEKTQVSAPAEGESDKASVSVEYAKSGRSTCKVCNENIVKDALRLGASFHDPRGFENTKWYHVACFPTSSYPIFPVEHLKGFDSIESHDREKLRELEENHKIDGSAADRLNEPNLKNEMVQRMGDSKDSTETNLEEVKNHKRGEAAVGPLEEPTPKKVKESGRSTCKGCNENIPNAALRLGASFHDPRGFENTKWYHVACFPTSSYSIFPVERLKGFDSIENQDREKLRELQENHKKAGNAADE
ncbi:hypothetical protein EJB05_52859, partial [Eragrostis curvula]